eukprot:15432823-Alexandrium_andersonii.AAC.1
MLAGLWAGVWCDVTAPLPTWPSLARLSVRSCAFSARRSTTSTQSGPRTSRHRTGGRSECGSALVKPTTPTSSSRRAAWSERGRFSGEAETAAGAHTT